MSVSEPSATGRRRHLSLRVRMGMAAGVAVALAVVAVSISAFAGTRSELLGSVDDQLNQLVQKLGPPHGNPQAAGAPTGGALFGGGGQLGGGQFGGGQFGGGQFGGGQFGGNPGSTLNFSNDCDNGFGIDRSRNPLFGGAPGYVQLVHPGGGVCLATGETTHLPVDNTVRQIARTGRGSYRLDTTIGSNHLRVLVHGVGSFGAVEVALPLGQVDRAMSRELLLLVLIAAVGVALAALLGVVVARTALSPIARFTRETEAIAAHPERLDHERLSVSGGDELARLGQTFNNTLDALERSVAAQRNLVADASHELRTPIATIRANIQLMRDEDLLSAEDREALRSDIIEELDELTALVSDVVELARGTKQSGAPGDERFDEIVRAAVERARRRYPAVAIETTLDPTLVHGEGDRISRAVSNLLDNAGKWSPPGGVIEVDLRGGVLTVRDHGPGFADTDLPFVFDRFHRARNARSKPGSGLGLAIVRQAAEAHGGFVEASNAPGGGAMIRIGFGPSQEIPESALTDAAGSSA